MAKYSKTDSKGHEDSVKGKQCSPQTRGPQNVPSAAGPRFVGEDYSSRPGKAK